jgi:hypothetical protein
MRALSHLHMQGSQEKNGGLSATDLWVIVQGSERLGVVVLETRAEGRDRLCKYWHRHRCQMSNGITLLGQGGPVLTRIRPAATHRLGREEMPL